MTCTEHHYTAQDGFRLYYRTYGGRGLAGTPVLCLTGLTRNAADFDRLARRLSAGRRLICPDYRGRGRSEWGDRRSYTPATYVGDVVHLMVVENVDRIAVIGTSLGGLLAMALGVVRPSALKGVIINDVGPDIGADGQERIMNYVGVDQRFADLAAAAEALGRAFQANYPDWTDDDWMSFADTTYRFDRAAGNWRLDYDLALAQAMREQARGGDLPDLWALFGGLRHVPAMLVHGARSDVLRPPTIERMLGVKPDLEVVTLENRGHAPTLTEPGCLPHVKAFLERLDAAGHH